MEQYIIRGGNPLAGEVEISGAKNAAARRLYQKPGYAEPDIVPCIFNGIPNVQQVLLEKKLT